jgi:succinate dehydrogenase / fumarate reductase, cytochrome b subunit
MTNLVATLAEGLRYRGHGGQWSWILHRISGLGTVLFVLIHVADTSTVYFFPQEYQFFIDLYRMPIFGLGEIALIACVLYHGLNGLRVTLFDLKPEWWTIERQRQSVLVTAVVFVVLFIPVVVIMGNLILTKMVGG